MTDSLFFDNDCISAFLWVGNENLLVKLYPGQVVIPVQVYNELSAPGVSHLKAKIELLLNSEQVKLYDIGLGTEEFSIYQKLTSSPDKGHLVIGKGEAACIAHAKCKNGIIASNNLKDISSYVVEFSLKHITTGDILIEALNSNLITEQEGNQIWANMLSKRRKLGAVSFTEYIASKK